MSAPVWRPLDGLDAADTLEARRQLHQAIQLLTAFTGAHLAPVRDDLHRSLCWEDGAAGFVTGSPTTSPDVRIEFGVADFELRVRRCENVDVLSLRGRTISDAREWLRGRVKERAGLDGELPTPEFDVPDHPVESGAIFDPPASGLERLARLYHDAQLILNQHAMHGDFPHRGVRCWPHHFDIAVLFEVGVRADGVRCTVGVGMAPFDAATETPYWYVTPYPYDFDAELADLPAGRWNTSGWLGAVLDVSEITELDGEAQFASVCDWLGRATAAAAATLGVDPGALDADPDLRRVPGAHAAG